MKKQWILGALVATTGLQSILPAQAIGANKEDGGRILGVVTGGLLGSQVGGGNGRIAATIFGGIVGSVVGGKIGRDLDQADRRAFSEAQRYCLEQGPNTSRSWSGSQYGSRTNARGRFVTARQGRHYQTNEICQEYSSSIYVNGRTENTTGIACRRSDGSFYEVSETQVRFAGDPVYDRDAFDSRDARDSRHDRRRDDRRRDRDEDRDDGSNDGPINYPVPPGRQIPPPPGGPGYGANALRISNISRLGGGMWYRVSFDRPVALTSIMLQSQGYGVKIHSTAVVTESGIRMQVPELTNTPVLAPQNPASGFINRPERVTAIDVRAESFGGSSSLNVIVRSNEPSTQARIQRF